MMSAIRNTELDEELTVRHALQRALSASGSDGRARSNALRALQHLDGRALEAVLLFLTRALSREIEAARIATAARHTELQSAVTAGSHSVGEIELDPIRRTVKKKNRFIKLSPKEFDLLHYLIARAGIPVRHAELLRRIWGVQYAQELEYLRTYIYHLRKKLEDHPTSPRYLLTEPCYGYRFTEAGVRPAESDTV